MSGRRQRKRTAVRQFFFGSATAVRWEEVKSLSPQRTYPMGTVLVHQGMPAREVLLLERGMVKLVAMGGSGRPVLVGIRASGWLIGAAAVLLGRPYAATAETVTECAIRHLEAGTFRQLVQTKAAVAGAVLRMHSEEVYGQVRRIVGLAGMTAEGRLRQLLGEMVWVQGSGVAAGVRVQVPLRRWELAQLVGVTAEHMSRLLARLEGQGVIRRAQGWIWVVDVERLWAEEA